MLNLIDHWENTEEIGLSLCNSIRVAKIKIDNTKTKTKT